MVCVGVYFQSIGEGASTSSIFLQGICGAMFMKLETFFLYTVPCIVMGYKVLWCNMQLNKPGTPEQTPSLFDKCTGFFYVHYTTHVTDGCTLQMQH